MAVDTTPELIQFEHFIRENVAKGKLISPEEALDLWRSENPNPLDASNLVLAIREALADMAAGDLGVPIDEFDRAFRQRHGLPLT